MSNTDLQAQCHHFAGGRPALAFRLRHLQEIISKFGERLAGVFPDTPDTLMRDAKLPVYGLAYSTFVRQLELRFVNGQPTIEATLTATVHPFGDPSTVISHYDVSLDQPLPLILSYSEVTRELRWAARVSPLANVNPVLSPNAEQILMDLGLPVPVLDTYERKVETAIIWNTSNSFVQLLLDALPAINLGEIAPWLTLLNPLLFDLSGQFLVVTSNKAKMTIGTCSPIEVALEPDPLFPYGMADPVVSTQSAASVAIYLPKTRIVEFVANSVMPAIMYDTGDRGGTIRWRITGAFGLKEFSVDVSGGIQMANPWAGHVSIRGTLSTSTGIVLTGVARAWIDGPCGRRIGLATASVQGDGAFAADIQITYRSPSSGTQAAYGATLEAELVVTKSELNPNIDIDAVGWPLDDVIGALGNHLIVKEVKKLSGTIHKIGRWQMLGIPEWFVDLVGEQAQISPIAESMGGVSTIVAIADRRG